MIWRRFLALAAPALAVLLFRSQFVLAEPTTESTEGVASDVAETASEVETQDFQAEVSRLMDIIINSLYTRKDVFLRELISNSADALEKARFLAVSDPKILAAEPDLKIFVRLDKDAKTVTIEDTGIGMTRDELITNLGTVARSGTTNFLEAFSHGQDVNLIGQFGVGFYSAFLVADRVTVQSRSATTPEEQYIWESNGASFSVRKDNDPAQELIRGTRVTLHLKDDSVEFLNQKRVTEAVKRANQFVNFPLMMWTTTTTTATEADLDEDDDDAVEESDNVPGKDLERETPKTITKNDWVQVNTQKPIWLRSKDDITREEYIQFYKEFTRDTQEPLGWLHFSAEGEVDFKALLYIPRDLTAYERELERYGRPEDEKMTNVKVYARRVLVAEELPEFLPRWMYRFVKGVVDSDDLPLKVDREGFSQSRMMHVIARKVESKILDYLKKLSKEDATAWQKFREQRNSAGSDPTESVEEPVEPSKGYQTFWEAYNRDISVGCVVDDKLRNKIVPLLRVHSSAFPSEETISLEQHVTRLDPTEERILYVTNENYERAMNQPHVRNTVRRGKEVLVLTDAYIETCLNRVGEFKEKSIQSVEKVNAGASADEQENQRKLQLLYRPLTDVFQTKLAKDVRKVTISARLLDDVAAISSGASAVSAFTERLIVQQRQGSKSQREVTKTRLLELNPRHPLIKQLLKIVEEEGPEDPRLDTAISSVFEMALLSSGFSLEDPSRVIENAVKAVATSIGADPDELPADVELTDEQKELIEERQAAKHTSDPTSMFDMDDMDQHELRKMLMEAAANRNEGAEEGDNEFDPSQFGGDPLHFSDGDDEKVSEYENEAAEDSDSGGADLHENMHNAETPSDDEFHDEL